MATLNETDEWVGGVYQIEQTDPVLGGAPNEATKAGLSNIPHLQLAKRTAWLKTRVDTLVSLVVAASTTVAGIVRLSTSVNSTSTTIAATSSAVKAANDNANARALASRTIAAGGLATGGGDLTANRTITVPAATKADAEAGADNAKAMTPLRVAQAIAALIPAASGSVAGLVRIGNSLATSDQAIAASTWLTNRLDQLITERALKSLLVSPGGLVRGGGDLSGPMTISVPAATKVEAEAGTANDKAMTPLRTAEAVAALVPAASATVPGVVRIGNSMATDDAAVAASTTLTKRLNDLITDRALKTVTITVNGLAAGGGDLSGPLNIGVPPATQAEAEAGASNGVAMTPLRTAQAIVAALAGLSGDAVGTVALMLNQTGAEVNTGVTAAGTGLRHASASGSPGNASSGTWKAMSITPAGQVGLFRRIA